MFYFSSVEHKNKWLDLQLHAQRKLPSWSLISGDVRLEHVACMFCALLQIVAKYCNLAGSFFLCTVQFLVEMFGAMNQVLAIKTDLRLPTPGPTLGPSARNQNRPKAAHTWSNSWTKCSQSKQT